MKLVDQYLKAIEKDLRLSKLQVNTEEVGAVSEVKDGVVIINGLDNVSYGELIEFESGVQGYVIELNEDEIGVIVLGNYLQIKAQEEVKALGKTLSIPVGNNLIGRVIDPLGNPLDSKDRVKTDTLYPV